jgi:hypothetical protein
MSFWLLSAFRRRGVRHAGAQAQEPAHAVAIAVTARGLLPANGTPYVRCLALEGVHGIIWEYRLRLRR